MECSEWSLFVHHVIIVGTLPLPCNIVTLLHRVDCLEILMKKGTAFLFKSCY